MPILEIKVTVPNLNPGDSNGAVARLQHILNDLDHFSGETLLNENGEFGRKTTDRVVKYQRDSHISPSAGGVGEKTWVALLEDWLINSVGD
jgi:peptidoglycan hydrolase-like protein with peptidoglycan-binding domain